MRSSRWMLKSVFRSVRPLLMMVFLGSGTVVRGDQPNLGFTSRDSANLEMTCITRTPNDYSYTFNLYFDGTHWVQITQIFLKGPQLGILEGEAELQARAATGPSSQLQEAVCQIEIRNKESVDTNGDSRGRDSFKMSLEELDHLATLEEIKGKPVVNYGDLTCAQGARGYLLKDQMKELCSKMQRHE